MIRFICIIAIAGCLSGCVHTGEEVANADDTKCRSYGIQPGTQPYVQCRMQLDHDRSTRQTANNLSNGGGIIGAIRSATQE